MLANTSVPTLRNRSFLSPEAHPLVQYAEGLLAEKRQILQTRANPSSCSFPSESMDREEMLRAMQLHPHLMTLEPYLGWV